MANYQSFLESNYQLNNLFSGVPALLNQYLAIEGNSVTKGVSFANTITSKAQQLIMWGIQKKSDYDGGGAFISNPGSVIDAFVPGRYAKAQVTLNPTQRDKDYKENFNIPRHTEKKKIQTIFPDIAYYEARDEMQRGIKQKDMFFYIRFMSPETLGLWNLLKLKASIGHQKIVDRFSNTWTGHSAFGRTQKNYIYSETERTLPLSFFEYAYSKDELNDLYRKLNYLARINYGYLETVNSVRESLRAGTVVYLTLGRLYRDMPAIITSMQFEFDEDLWDIDEFVPMMVKISISFTLLHYTNPSNKDNFFYLGEDIERADQAENPTAPESLSSSTPGFLNSNVESGQSPESI